VHNYLIWKPITLPLVSDTGVLHWRNQQDVLCKNKNMASPTKGRKFFKKEEAIEISEIFIFCPLISHDKFHLLVFPTLDL